MSEPVRVISLYSGSGGNSTYIRAAGTSILIDAGKSARALCASLRRIGVEPEEISAIFITHEHSDHVSALEVLTKKHPIPIHMVRGCAEHFCAKRELPISACICTHPPLFSEQVGALTVTSFPTPHDSHASVGYRITFSDGEGAHHIGFATDIGYVSEEIRAGLLGCEAVVLESNHDPDMLMKGPYPYDLKRRVASRRGHLSNRECADFAATLAANGTRGILLAHLSKENNIPDLALDETRSAVSDPRVSVLAADPDLPVELILEASEEDFDFEREMPL